MTFVEVKFRNKVKSNSFAKKSEYDEITKIGDKAKYQRWMIYNSWSTCLFAIGSKKIFSFLFSSQNNYYRTEGQYDPEEIMDMLNRLGNLIQIERKMEK